MKIFLYEKINNKDYMNLNKMNQKIFITLLTLQSFYQVNNFYNKDILNKSFL